MILLLHRIATVQIKSLLTEKVAEEYEPENISALGIVHNGSILRSLLSVLRKKIFPSTQANYQCQNKFVFILH